MAEAQGTPLAVVSSKRSGMSCLQSMSRATAQMQQASGHCKKGLKTWGGVAWCKRSIRWLAWMCLPWRAE